MSYLKKAVLAAACAGGMFAVGQAQAADWLMLQGTEPAGASARAKVFGAVQVNYQKDFSHAGANGNYIPPMMIGPNLTSQSAFNVPHALIGVRGTGLPLDSHVNYFLLVDAGNNAITRSDNAFAKVTDASITLNYIPHARVRVGMFKYPGAEESFQALATMDYVNFTMVTNQLLLERIPNKGTISSADNKCATGCPAGEDENAFTQPAAGFRDVGVEVFDAFRTGSWEHSYAIMIGNGNGLNFTDNNNSKDIYLYWASEKIFSGKGPFRQGLKLFAWSQTGKRRLERSGGPSSGEFKRNRYGVGVRYFKLPFRVTAEYMQGKGMIFVGPHLANFMQGTGDGATGKAFGYYVEGGWYVPHTPWELDLRYDYYNRLHGNRFESHWRALTVGTQYHLNKKTKVTFDFEFHKVSSPNFPSGAGPNAFMDNVGNRVGLQVTHLF
jgi:hypothetical protein